MDKYFVGKCSLLPKRRSNLVDKAATFCTQSEKKIDVLVTPGRILTLIISFRMSDAADIVVLISKVMMFSSRKIQSHEFFYIGRGGGGINLQTTGINERRLKCVEGVIVKTE